MPAWLQVTAQFLAVFPSSSDALAAHHSRRWHPRKRCKHADDKLGPICYVTYCVTLDGAEMVEVSSAEVQRNFGVYREMAEGTKADPEAVTVLHYNRPSVVIVSAEEYARLKRRDKRVVLTEDLPEWLAQQVASSEMEPRFAHLDEPT